MEEVTIKVNKSMLFLVAGLIVGLGLGYYGGNFRAGKAVATGGNNQQVAAQNNPPPADEVQQPSVPVKINVTKDDHIRGAKNPQVYLVEYSDFQCPFCQRHHPTMQQAFKEYGNKAAWVFRHYPLSFHQNAQIAAEGSECASEQGKFWEFADVLFAKGQGDGTGLTPPDLEQYAKQLGMNGAQFGGCLASKKYASKVSAGLAQGNSLGVNGTPATFVVDKNGNATLISGAVPYETLKASIDAALQ